MTFTRIALGCLLASLVAAAPAYARSPVHTCDWTNNGGHQVRPPGLCGDGPSDVPIEIPIEVTASIPEPGTLALLGAGIAAVAASRRKHKKIES